MNPWMSEMLGAAHREEIRRSASGPDRHGSSLGRATGRPAGTRWGATARRRAGRALIRAGTRLTGMEQVTPVALTGPPHPAAC